MQFGMRRVPFLTAIHEEGRSKGAFLQAREEPGHDDRHRGGLS